MSVFATFNLYKQPKQGDWDHYYKFCSEMDRQKGLTKDGIVTSAEEVTQVFGIKDKKIAAAFWEENKETYEDPIKGKYEALDQFVFMMMDVNEDGIATE